MLNCSSINSLLHFQMPAQTAFWVVGKSSDAIPGYCLGKKAAQG